jgi:carboxypeptidase family protein
LYTEGVLSLPPLARSPVLLLSLAALVGASMPAGATHLPDHRFLVLGYVTDADGRPVAGVRVVVTRLKTGLEYPTTTERDGFYIVVLHLHDENLGEALGVDAKGVKGEVRARFEVSDKKVERGTRVDMRDRRLVENRSAFAETLRAYLSR